MYVTLGSRSGFIMVSHVGIDSSEKRKFYLKQISISWHPECISAAWDVIFREVWFGVIRIDVV